MQIVIAWTEDDQVLVKAGQPDIGRPHTFKTVKKPMACMWLNKGTEADLAKAKDYALKNGRTVLCYQNMLEPLEAARQEIMTRA